MLTRIALRLNASFRSFSFFSLVGFEVLTAVVMKSIIFWDVMPCSPLKVSDVGRLATCFHAGILLALFDPENGGHMFLRNFG
jgi:hypothetical protein